MFNESVLSVLKENCGIGAEKIRHASKRGQKIIPGQPILELQVERNSPADDQPLSSKRNKKKNYTQKNQIKKENQPKKQLLMMMTRYVLTVVKLGMMIETVAG